MLARMREQAVSKRDLLGKLLFSYLDSHRSLKADLCYKLKWLYIPLLLRQSKEQVVVQVVSRSENSDGLDILRRHLVSMLKDEVRNAFAVRRSHQCLELLTIW